MNAVILNKGLLYLGDDYVKSVSVFYDNKGSTHHTDVTLEKLSELLGFAQTVEPPLDDRLSQAVQTLVQKLEDLGVNQELAEKVKENSEKVVAEVRHLGVKSMKTVGDGFVALGDILRNGGQSTPSNPTK